MKRKKWTKTEDKLLVEIKNKYTNHTWSEISEKMFEFGLKKKSNQCKDRWKNHLNPNLLKTDWTKIEDEKLLELYDKYKGKWKEISKRLIGRSENCIKNRFFAQIRKALRKCFKNTMLDFSINYLKPRVLCDLFLNNNQINFEKDSNLNIGIKDFLLNKLQKRNFSYEKNKNNISNILLLVKKLNDKYLEKKKLVNKSYDNISDFRLKKISKRTKKLILKEKRQIKILNNKNLVEFYLKLFEKLEEISNIFKTEFKREDIKNKRFKIIKLYHDFTHLCDKVAKKLKNGTNFQLREIIKFTNENLQKYYLDIEVPQDLVSIKEENPQKIEKNSQNVEKETQSVEKEIQSVKKEIQSVEKKYQSVEKKHQSVENFIIIPNVKSLQAKSDLFSLMSMPSELILKKLKLQKNNKFYFPSKSDLSNFELSVYQDESKNSNVKVQKDTFFKNSINKKKNIDSINKNYIESASLTSELLDNK